MTLPNLATGTFIMLSFSQSASSNWAQPTQDFLNVSSSVSTSQIWTPGALRIRPSAAIRLGATYVDDTTSDNDLRLAENELFFEAVASYNVDWKVNPYVSANLRSTLTESFYYTRQGRVRFAKFWDPVTSQQALGFTLLVATPGTYVSTRVGVALQQIRAEHHTQLTDDFSTRDVRERYRVQSGLEWVTEASLQLDTSISYVGRLGLIGSFQHLDVWALRSENTLRFRLWKFLGVTLGVNIIHDVRQSLRTQFRQTIMVGIVQSF